MQACITVLTALQIVYSRPPPPILPLSGLAKKGLRIKFKTLCLSGAILRTSLSFLILMFAKFMGK